MQRPEDWSALTLPSTAVAFCDSDELRSHLGALPGATTSMIGHSRGGQPLFGYTMGTGPRLVSITAGCHADEPAGPMTAQALPLLLRDHAPSLLERFTFRVIPQMNPDGADNNRPWFSLNPDFASYVAHAVREMPGDDVEFGFSMDDAARPECRAAIPFLWHEGPVVAHFSLHGMAWAEGAWYLINRPWVERADGLMADLTAVTEAFDMPFHEIDRHGEKGFSRIGNGFATTPSSVAMKAFFEAEDDLEMAAKFRPSSMEMAMETGDDPLCMVSELPLFLLDVPASLEEPVLFRFRDAMNAARARNEPDAIKELARAFRVRTVPWETQMRLQFAMMVNALEHVACYRARPSK